MKRKKIKKQYLRCPCCKHERYATEITKVAQLIKELEQKAYQQHYKSLKSDYGELLKSGDYDFACDDCLQRGKAIMAIPGLQNYCWYPNLAYYDTIKSCESCQKDFTFSKKEKQFWYENLKFWIESTAKNCKDCRRTIRALKEDNTKVSKLLQSGVAILNTDDLKEVIEIYTRMNKPDRVKYYQSFLK